MTAASSPRNPPRRDYVSQCAHPDVQSPAEKDPGGPGTPPESAPHCAQVREVLRGRLGHIRGLFSLGAIDDLEFHLLALAQGPEARALNGSEMHEDILAIGTLDEPIALGIIEPLHFTI
jgi:hypothetical protein